MTNRDKKKKRWCPRRTNVGLDPVSIAPLDRSMDDTKTYAWTCKQVCKNEKKQRKPNGWYKASIKTSHAVEKSVYQAHQHHRDVSHEWSHPTSHKMGGCNHASKWPQRPKSTSPWRAQSMAKPRSRQTNMDKKHKSKQKNVGMHKGNDPNPLI